MIPIFLLGLISLWLLILFVRKHRPLDKEDKRLTIIIAVFTSAIVVFFGAFQVLEYYRVPPPNLIPTLTIILYILTIILCIFACVKAYMPCKKHLTNNLKKHYHKKLSKEIRYELENEVATRNIILEPEEKDEVLQSLTESVTSDIIKGQLQIYKVQKAIGNSNCLKLSGLIFTVSQESEEIIAQKMTALSNNPKYRKRIYRYSSLFN